MYIPGIICIEHEIRRKLKDMFLDFLILVFTCVVCAVVFLGRVLREQGIEGLFNNI